MNFKKISSFLVLAIFSLTGFNAFAKDVHGVFCGSELRPNYVEIADEYMKNNPGVNVTLEAVPWGTCQDKVINLAIAGDPVAFSYVGSRTLKGLAENGHILETNIPAAQQAMYQPGILNTVTHMGKTWGYPHAFSTKALFMNCGLLEQAGVSCEGPQSWDDLYSMAEAVTNNVDGASGIGLAGKDFDNTMHQFLNYLYSNGGQVIDSETNKITLNSPETVETLEFYGKLVSVAQDGPTAFERSQLKDLFNDEKVAMYIDGPWGRGQHKKTLKTIAVPIPSGPSGTNGTLLITDSLAVFKGTGHEDVAMELARALSSGAAQYDLDSSWGLTPIMKYEGMVDNPYYVNSSYWSVFVEPIGSGGPEPLFVEYKSLQTVMNSMIQGIVLGEGSAKDLVATAAQELEEFK